MRHESRRQIDVWWESQVMWNKVLLKSRLVPYSIAGMVVVMLFALLWPALAVIDRTPSPIRSSLKQIGIGLKSYNSVHGVNPKFAMIDQDDRPLLSWRVTLLAYLEIPECNKLAEEFHPDEPWDSPHNQRLIAKMPEVYQHPDSEGLNKTGRTRFVVPVGEDTAYPPGRVVRPEDYRDGEQNTVVAVEVDEDHAVVWTKPDDLVINRDHPTRGLGRPEHGDAGALFADTHVEWIQLDDPRVDWNALFTIGKGDDPWPSEPKRQ